MDVSQAYKLITERKEKFGKFHKCLFHIHTPASHDFRLIRQYDNEQHRAEDKENKAKGVEFYKGLTDEDIFEIARKENLFPCGSIKNLEAIVKPGTFTDKKEYLAFLLIAHKLLLNDIELVVVADHHTFSGVRKLGNAIAEYKKAYPKHGTKHTHVLPGIEISCADKNHVVGIFSDNNEEGLKEFESWLAANIINEEDGTFQTSWQVMDEIEKHNGIAYIAHINTSNTFTKEFFTDAYRKQLCNRRQNIIGVTDISFQKMYCRHIRNYNHLSPICIFLDSDSHSIDTLHDKHFFIKGEKLGFDMIVNAIRDNDIAIKFKEEKELDKYIIGIAIPSCPKGFLSGKATDKEPFVLNFSSSFNCFIGGRGTGKSTVLNILNFVLGQHLPTDQNSAIRTLDFICGHEQILVAYKYQDEVYMIEFQPPKKEYECDDTLKKFGAPSYLDRRNNSRIFTYDPKAVAESTLERIDLYKLSTRTNGFDRLAPADKRKILPKMFKSGHIVNELVNTANSGIDEYIRSKILENNDLRIEISFKKNLSNILKEIPRVLSNRKSYVEKKIEPYNSSQEKQKKLRITYTQEDQYNSHGIFSRLVKDPGKPYKNFNITQQNVEYYLANLCDKLGFIAFLKMFADKDYTRIGSNTPYDFLMRKDRSGEGSLWCITNENIDSFYDSLRNDIMSEETFWKTQIQKYVQAQEQFDLELNIANKEQAQKQKPDFRPVARLSLGQKVVAMLSFILSYSDFIKDTTPLIIDQPEDNLDNRYIYKNLVKDLRDMRGKRQVIIATHNSTIVTNAKAEQVIVMESDNKKGWIENSGYPTQPSIVTDIINHLEGGKDSFEHKKFIYTTTKESKRK